MGDRIAEIEKRLKAATPGPWRWEDVATPGQFDAVPALRGQSSWMAYSELASNDPSLKGQRIANAGTDVDGLDAIVMSPEDAAFIIHAPEDVAWLVARVLELEDGLRSAAIDIEILLAVHGGDIQTTARCALDQRVKQIRIVLAEGVNSE